MNAQAYMKGKDNKAIIESLKKVLADSYVVYFKTHSFHWNVTGPNFKALHDMFEEQYTELWKAIDDIAERIRILEGYAPNSFDELLKPASIKEAGQTPDADGMVKILAEDNLALVDTLMDALKQAENAGDEATVDMMIERIDVHEKSAWMLKSSL